MINPAPNQNRHEPTEDGSDIWGNTMPGIRYYEDLNRKSCPSPLVGRGIAEGHGIGTPQLDTFYPTFRQEEPRRYDNHAWSSFNIDVGSDLSEESKPLFPGARNPGKFPCWISRIIGSSCWTESSAWRTLTAEEGLHLHRGYNGVCQPLLPDNAVVEYSAKGKDEWSYKPSWCEQGQL